MQVFPSFSSRDGVQLFETREKKLSATVKRVRTTRISPQLDTHCERNANRQLDDLALMHCSLPLFNRLLGHLGDLQAVFLLLDVAAWIGVFNSLRVYLVIYR